MVEFICPSCQARTDVPDANQETRCHACGRPLGPSEGDAAVAVGADVPDDGLVAELREAFGFGTNGLERHKNVGRERGNAAGGDVQLTEGSWIDDFEILHELGRGGMGVVYRARQASLHRQVALKVLPGALWRSGSAVHRFRREAQAAARLNHANVVPVYAQGEHDGSYFYAMRLVEGVPLDTAIKSRPELLSSSFASSATSISSAAAQPTSRPGSASEEGSPPVDETESDRRATTDDRTTDDFRHLATLIAGVAEGLAHAHENGVVHRDIKPNNLILGDGPRLFITDFGLAFLSDEPHVTQTGEVMGTPSYLSPEQARGDVGTIDHRTDIYSLGATLYELLTHERPFQGASRDQIMTAICQTEPRRPRQISPRIPVDLETICLRALEKEPARRYATALDMADDLRRYAEGRPIRSRRISPAERAYRWVRRHKAVSTAAVAVVAALAIGSGWALSNHSVRKQEANRLVADAYDSLVHLDYHRPDLVADEVERAAQLGADEDRLLLVRSILSMGMFDQLGAIAQLEELVGRDPTYQEAWYLLAWAHTAESTTCPRPRPLSNVPRPWAGRIRPSSGSFAAWRFTSPTPARRSTPIVRRSSAGPRPTSSFRRRSCTSLAPTTSRCTPRARSTTSAKRATACAS